MEKANAVSVIERIEVERSTTARHRLTRKAGRLPSGLQSRESLINRPQERKQMTAAAQAGALSRVELNWHAMDWHAAHRIVRRLQARIVKATQESRWGKVRTLQHLLTHSLSGKLLAVKQVTENSGNRTPGVDRIVWNTPAKKEAAVQALKQREYQPLPLRRVYIPKSNGKMRPLGIPAMKDRAMPCIASPEAPRQGSRP
jgi:N-terminal domain of reverse transcriptase